MQPRCNSHGQGDSAAEVRTTQDIDEDYFFPSYSPAATLAMTGFDEGMGYDLNDALHDIIFFNARQEAAVDAALQASHGQWGHSDAASYILYGESLMQY
jgi:hypothetical protein